jgi:hypothetical protein
MGQGEGSGERGAKNIWGRKRSDGGPVYYSSQNTLTYDDCYKYREEYPQTSHRERRFIRGKGASISDAPIDQEPL